MKRFITFLISTGILLLSSSSLGENIPITKDEVNIFYYLNRAKTAEEQIQIIQKPEFLNHVLSTYRLSELEQFAAAGGFRSQPVILFLFNEILRVENTARIQASNSPATAISLSGIDYFDPTNLFGRLNLARKEIETVRKTMYSLLPMYGVGPQQIMSLLESNYKAHSNEQVLIKSSYYFITQNEFENIIYGLLRSGYIKTKDQLLSAIATFGSTFGVQDLRKLDERSLPYVAQLWPEMTPQERQQINSIMAVKVTQTYLDSLKSPAPIFQYGHRQSLPPWRSEEIELIQPKITTSTGWVKKIPDSGHKLAKLKFDNPELKGAGGRYTDFIDLSNGSASQDDFKTVQLKIVDNLIQIKRIMHIPKDYPADSKENFQLLKSDLLRELIELPSKIMVSGDHVYLDTENSIVYFQKNPEKIDDGFFFLSLEKYTTPSWQVSPLKEKGQTVGYAPLRSDAILSTRFRVDSKGLFDIQGGLNSYIYLEARYIEASSKNPMWRLSVEVTSGDKLYQNSEKKILEYTFLEPVDGIVVDSESKGIMLVRLKSGRVVQLDGLDNSRDYNKEGVAEAMDKLNKVQSEAYAKSRMNTQTSIQTPAEKKVKCSMLFSGGLLSGFFKIFRK